MKLLLVAPPWLHIYADYREAAKLGCVSPPLGLMYLGASVERAGHQCRIVDMESMQVGPDRLLEIIAEYQPDLIGITATTPVYANACDLAVFLKEKRPELPLVLGGVHATIVGRQAMEECQAFDYEVVGEGENTLVELMEALADGAGPAGIRGVIHREKGLIVENPPRPLESDLDSLPSPARHLLDPDLFKHHLPGRGEIRYASLFTSRGCPFKCIFCSQHTMYGRRMRWHGLDRVMDELEYIVKEQGIDHVIIMDETLTLNHRRTMEFCQAIHDRGLKFTWEGWTRANTVDEELLRTMKAAGLVRLSFGIESGDPEILKVIKKEVTLDDLRQAYRIAGKVGIEMRGSAMLGHPHETKATAWRTIRFCRSIRELKQLFLNIACPYPGTELYEYAANGRGGMRLLTNDYSRYKRYGDPVIEVNDLSAKDLMRLQTVGLLYFYLTPSRIWYNMVKRAGIKSGMVNAMAFCRGVLERALRK